MTFLSDLRLAFRTLAKSPAFSAAAIVTLALGIGANTAVFTVLHAVLVRPLPYPDAGRLVRIWESNPEKGMPRFSASPRNLVDWRERARSFSGLAAYVDDRVTLAGEAGAERIQGEAATPELFPLLGVTPLLGRPFREEEGKPGEDAVVILSEPLWRTRFGADPGILGRTLTLSGKARTVVGVMPASFRFPSAATALWMPLAFDERDLGNRGAKWLGVVGRLRPRVSLDDASRELSAIASEIAVREPDKGKGWGVVLAPYLEAVVGKVRKPVQVLFAAAALVLLVACVNVSSLLLARAASRHREAAVRTALGAGRARLLSQMVAEATVISLVGAALGIALALLATPALVRLAGDALPRRSEVTVGLVPLAFAAVAGALAALLGSIAPARGWMRLAPWRALTDRNGAVPLSRSRRGLVVAELALTLALLTGAGLLLRSLGSVLDVDPGFRPDHALTASVSLPGERYGKDEARINAFYADLTTRLSALPGVQAAGAITVLPLSGGNWSLEVKLPDRHVPAGEAPSLEYRQVTAGFFAALQVPLRKGRLFDERDAQGQPLVAVVSEAAARRLWPGEDPIGKELVIGDRTPAPRRVVGVVGDLHDAGLDRAVEPEVYVPSLQKPARSMSLVVRTTGDPLALAPALREVVRGLDRDVPVESIDPMESVLAASVSSRRFVVTLLALFAALALALAAVGVYGLVAHAAEERRREIGIRMALGARSRDVLEMVLRQGAMPLAAGIGAGLLLSLASARLVSGLLFGVTVADPATYAAVIAVLTAITLVASWLPARRAAASDPAAVLRSE